MLSKKGLTHVHWISFSLMTLALAFGVAGIIAGIILTAPPTSEFQANQRSSLSDVIVDEFALGESYKGNTNENLNRDCEDPNKYAHLELGCICKPEFKTTVNLRGSFCVGKLDSIHSQSVEIAGEKSVVIEEDCNDPRKYFDKDLGCRCKPDFRPSSNYRGTFCIEKGRTYSYWPE